MSQLDSPPPAPPPTYSLLGGLLSYLVPGLGQIVQGRVGKGLMFLICLYTMFFYGLYLGHWQNVHLQQPINQPGGKTRDLDLYISRIPFFGQFFIGVAAWPALWQNYTFKDTEDAHPILGKFERLPKEKDLNDQLRNDDKSPDLGLMYTIIAGVLNILVIYDAFAGPAMGRPPASPTRQPSEAEGVAR